MGILAQLKPFSYNKTNELTVTGEKWSLEIHKSWSLVLKHRLQSANLHMNGTSDNLFMNGVIKAT